MIVSTYEFTKTAEFHINENGTLKGVAICGPGRDQRSYYAVKPALGEGTLSLDILEEALGILKLFNPNGYDLIVSQIIPDTIKELGD